LGAHLPLHLEALALGLHLIGAWVSWAAAGRAKVAAVSAARDASLNWVFM
jgi:hypothetical protein